MSTLKNLRALINYISWFDKGALEEYFSCEHDEICLPLPINLTYEQKRRIEECGGIIDEGENCIRMFI